MTPWFIVGAVAVATAVVIYLAPDDAPVDVSGAGATGPDAAGATTSERCRVERSVHQLGPPIAEDERDQPVAPFAPELGRAIVHRDGFAVGIKRQHEGAVVAEVAIINKDDRTKTVALGTLRGDVDPPLVVAAGDGLVVALPEPNASGMALRLARIDGGEVVWGDDLPQGRDESLAFDVGFNERGGLVVWDDVERESARAYVALTSVSPSLSNTGAVQSERVSRLDVDGEVPRLAERPGGFWLAYVARAPLLDNEGQGGAGRMLKHGDADAGRYAAELIERSWLELVPLDELGRVEGASRPVTAQDGHVLDYELGVSANGDALLVWRDDDTPSGAHGGRVSLLRVGMSGGAVVEVVVEDNVGSGAPTLLNGLLALSDRRGRVRVAPLDPHGVVTGELSREDALGPGLPLAGSPAALLWARAAAASLELLIVRCDTATALNRADESTPPDGGSE